MWSHTRNCCGCSNYGNFDRKYLAFDDGSHHCNHDPIWLFASYVRLVKLFRPESAERSLPQDLLLLATTLSGNTDRVVVYWTHVVAPCTPLGFFRKDMASMPWGRVVNRMARANEATPPTTRSFLALLGVFNIGPVLLACQLPSLSGQRNMTHGVYEVAVCRPCYCLPRDPGYSQWGLACYYSTITIVFFVDWPTPFLLVIMLDPVWLASRSARVCLPERLWPRCVCMKWGRLAAFFDAMYFILLAAVVKPWNDVSLP